MSAKSACAECIKADKTRTKDGRIRCTRYSKWVYPFDESCEEYVNVELWKRSHNNLTPQGKPKEES